MDHVLTTPVDDRDAEYRYKTAGGRQLTLRFLPPLQRRGARAPLYFLIPGGGWNSADKDSMLAFSRLSVAALREAGFAVAAAAYRTGRADGVTMREIVSDVFDAMRFVARHAAALAVDPHRVVTSGHSAGGHLALMLAAAPGELFGAQRAAEDFTVVATAPLSGVTSLTPVDGAPFLSFGVEALLTGAEEAADCSPLTWAAGCPPAFLVYGTHDPLVYPCNSEYFAARCPSAELVPSQGGQHGFEPAEGFTRASPGFDEIQRRLAAFILKRVTV